MFPVREGKFFVNLSNSRVGKRRGKVRLGLWGKTLWVVSLVRRKNDFVVIINDVELKTELKTGLKIELKLSRKLNVFRVVLQRTNKLG